MNRHLRLSLLGPGLFACLVSAAALAQNRMLLQEDFNNNAKKWFTADDAQAIAKIAGGKYYVEIKQSGSVHTWVPVTVKQEGDFLIEARLRELRADNPGGGYGLMWGGSGKSSSYLFLLSGKNYFTHGRSLDGKWEGISWSTSEHLRSGEVNTLAVHKTGQRLEYLVNGEVVSTAPFESFFGNFIGFVINGPRTVEIDYLRVEQLAPGRG